MCDGSVILVLSYREYLETSAGSEEREGGVEKAGRVRENDGNNNEEERGDRGGGDKTQARPSPPPEPEPDY